VGITAGGVGATIRVALPVFAGGGGGGAKLIAGGATTNVGVVDNGADGAEVLLETAGGIGCWGGVDGAGGVEVVTGGGRLEAGGGVEIGSGTVDIGGALGGGGSARVVVVDVCDGVGGVGVVGGCGGAGACLRGPFPFAPPPRPGAGLSSSCAFSPGLRPAFSSSSRFPAWPSPPALLPFELRCRFSNLTSSPTLNRGGNRPMLLT
jgi:hypothetical protein